MGYHDTTDGIAKGSSGSIEPPTPVEHRTLAFIATDELRPGADAFIRRLLALDIAPVIVSGAPQEILELHAGKLGISSEDVHGLKLARDGWIYGRDLKTGNMAISKAERVAVYQGTSEIGVGVGVERIADEALVGPASLSVWVDRNADTETSRLTWSGSGGDGSGSFEDLTAAMERLPWLSG